MEGKQVVVNLEQLDRLEERITRTAERVRALVRERDAARAEAAEARERLLRLEAEVRRLEEDGRGAREANAELEVLREERQAVRTRVTRMLEMMAALDDSAAQARTDH